MKRYYNETTKEWYTEGRSLTRKTDKGLFSGIPTEQQLSEWGFKEYAEPEPEPLTAEQIAEQQRQQRMAEIQAELQSLDYLTSKYIDGEDMSEYGDWQERRRSLRAEYNRLEQESATTNTEN